MREQIHLPTAAVFYLLYLAGIIIFAVIPATVCWLSHIVAAGQRRRSM
jgi:uncharacterized membrane protein